MQRKPRIALLIIVVIGLLALARTLLVYEDAGMYACEECFATRTVRQWEFGMGGAWSTPLGAKSEEVRPSQITTDFFPQDHRHQWVLMEYFSGPSYSKKFALGKGVTRNDIRVTYEALPEFRAFIHQRIKAGNLTAEGLLRLAHTPEYISDEWRLTPEEKRDNERARQLLFDFRSGKEDGE